ncbi:pyrroline-5-carboxylate reductase dimerization-domain-containing protein [Aspergillus cavernicola]|uniref:Pyrroline-5-carboxylate reductase dimerization-domain-containing protein n=1 Tax=Aspergillus cavernicola TaxID=176166 RepID=A0ABR4J2K6_9EURO
MSNTLCILGCGNLGTAILQSLLTSTEPLFTHYIACVSSESSSQRLSTQFASSLANQVTVSINDNVNSIQDSNVIILALDPSIIHHGLTQPGLREALDGKLLISVVAGWTRQKLEETLYGSESTTENTNRACIIRTLPNIAALVSQSLTAIETDLSHPIPEQHLSLAESIFSRIGKTIRVPPSLMDATTAVAGSTPAMFAIIADAMVDAAVAVGVPRAMAQTMIFQAMQGTAGMLQSGVHPALLKDQGTSPEGCTIGGVMVLEEGGVRGVVGRAVREAVTVARGMDGKRHVNDTRGFP